MAICPTTSTVYQEEIKTIVFRADDGIMIPKLVREQAYELAIDVIIRSIPREVYKNYECSPPESFFGNATIVFQDCLDLKIPLKFPRQRIYYGRVSEAFEQWNALVNFEYMRAYFLAVGETIQSLGTALGITSLPATLCCSLAQPTWRELPIREAYVNVPAGTQYEIEVTWLTPEPFTDSCGTFYEGLSGQDDGDKDDGLPPNGSFPNVAASASDPFAGLPSATPDSEQGGFSSSKIANLDDVDPDNEPETTPPGQRYLQVITIQSRPSYSVPCVTRRRITEWTEVLEGVFVIGQRRGSLNLGTVCAGQGDLTSWEVQLTGGSYFNVGYSNDAPAVSIIYSTTSLTFTDEYI